MTLRDFMDASYALLAEEHQRIQPLTSLLDVAERLNPAPAERPARKQETKASNEESYNILTAAMSGVKGKAPVQRRKPRV